MMKSLSRIAATVAALILPGCHPVSDNVVLAASVFTITQQIRYGCGKIIDSGQRVGDKTDGQFRFTADHIDEYKSNARTDVCDCKAGSDVSGCNIVLGTGGAEDTDPSIGFAEVRPSQDGFKIDAKGPSLPPFPPADSPNFSRTDEYAREPSGPDDTYTYAGPFAMVKQGDRCRIDIVAGRNASLSDNARDADDIAMNCDALRSEFETMLDAVMQQAQARP